jgi:transcriptional regulator with XRE-family HTH domain
MIKGKVLNKNLLKQAQKSGKIIIKQIKKNILLNKKMEASKKLGEIIKSIREKNLSLTQKDFSEKLNITTVYVSYLEKGKRPPSLDLITSVYSLIGENVPEEVKQMLGEIRKDNKKKNISVSPIDIIYELEEKKIYDYAKLKKALKSNPQDLVMIYGIIRILIEEGKTKEAKKHLLKYLLKVEKPEDKKWLEASYYELENNLPVAIQFLNESVREFEKNLESLDDKSLKIRARLIFQLASLHFRFGQQLYRSENYESAIENFKKSLEWHTKVRKIYQDPFYQIDYAGTFLWLALLGIEPAQNWNNYIIEAKNALFFNHYKGMANFSSSHWQGLYSKQSIISTISFLARAFAQAAQLEKNPEKKFNLLNEGEFLLVQHTPIDLGVKYEEYYRFYFNEACFYSIKAEIYSEFKKDYNEELEHCFINLQEAKFADSNNKLNLFSRELNSSKGLSFFRSHKTKQLNELLKMAYAVEGKK